MNIVYIYDHDSKIFTKHTINCFSRSFETASQVSGGVIFHDIGRTIQIKGTILANPEKVDLPETLY